MSKIKIKNGYLFNEDGAVAVDASVWFMSERDLQTAADAGALAAAYEIANGDSSNAETVAGREAGNNGFDSAKGTLDMTV